MTTKSLKVKHFKNWPFPVAGKINPTTKKMLGEPVSKPEPPKGAFFDKTVNDAVEKIMSALFKNTSSK